MANSQNKLRPDLEIHPEEDSGVFERGPDGPERGSGVIIKDPIKGRFYRFSPVQASVLSLLDGQRDPESIAAVVSRKHRMEVLAGQIEEFIVKLRALLLLEDPDSRARLGQINTERPGRLQNLLHIKIYSFNPDKLLTLMEKKSRFLFSGKFQYLFGILALFAFILLILHRKSLFISMADLLSLYSVPLILIVVSAIATIHEFAHGIALKRYGGKAEGMGLMLLYFIPSMYCNVSDSWTMKKRERIIIAMAGGYIQLVMLVAAILLWRLLSPETLASRICLISIIFNSLLSFINLNPLIRLDGYYMLSDFVEIPNLRAKAFSYLKQKGYAWLTGAEYAGNQGWSRKENRVLFLYGAASCMFSAGLILFLASRFSGWMVREYQTWGVIMTSMLFAMAAPALIKVKMPASGKYMKALLLRFRKSPKTIIVLALILLCSFFPWELKIAGEFTIVSLNEADVTPQVSGNIIKIYVDEGSHVSSGSLLAKIENLELADSYQETVGELATQKASLDLLKAGARPEEIEKARRLVETKKAEYENSGRIIEQRAVLLGTIEKKQVELDNARSDFERTQSLLKNGLIARNEADRYRMEFDIKEKELSESGGRLKILEEETDRNRDIKRKELAQSESELRLLLAGTRMESIRASESQVEKLEQKLWILEKELELQNIRSPIDGIVATPYLRNRIGDFLNKGDILCKIVSEGTVRIKMPIPEKEIGDVEKGFPITMKVRVYPHRSYKAHIQDIAPVTTGTESGKVVIVHGELDNSDGSLKSGMTGVGKILCGKRMILNIASRRAIRWFRTEFWEYLP